MGRVLIETTDEKNIQITTSLTSEEVESLMKNQEDRKKMEIALTKLRGILHTNKTAEELIGEIYEEIYDR